MKAGAVAAGSAATAPTSMVVLLLGELVGSGCRRVLEGRDVAVAAELADRGAQLVEPGHRNRCAVGKGGNDLVLGEVLDGALLVLGEVIGLGGGVRRDRSLDLVERRLALGGADGREPG